jgi:hypothetical protein
MKQRYVVQSTDVGLLLKINEHGGLFLLSLVMSFVFLLSPRRSFRTSFRIDFHRVANYLWTVSPPVHWYLESIHSPLSPFSSSFVVWSMCVCMKRDASCNFIFCFFVFNFFLFHFCSLLFSSFRNTHLPSQENIGLHNAVMGDGNASSDGDHTTSFSGA